jgi:hypothetical protein
VDTCAFVLIGLSREEGLDSSNFGMTEKNETVWIKWNNVEQCFGYLISEVFKWHSRHCDFDIRAIIQMAYLLSSLECLIFVDLDEF